MSFIEESLKRRKEAAEKRAQEKHPLKIFISREDCYAQQQKNGSYSSIKEELTEKILDLHLEGKQTIGAYQLSNDGLVIWGCFDFDEDTLEDFEKAKKSYQILKKEGFHPLIEKSGGGKYKVHVWIFCKLTTARDMKMFLEDLCERINITPHEIFPKQEQLKEGGFGNLVKIPLGVNLKTGERSKILNDDFEELSQEEAVERLVWHSKNLDVIPKIIIKEQRFIQKGVNQKADSLGECAFLGYAINNLLPKGSRHEIISKNLAIYICNKPDRKELEEKYVRSQQGKEDELTNWLKSVEEGKYTKINCGELIKYQHKEKIPLKCGSCPNYLLNQEVSEDTIHEIRGLKNFNKSTPVFVQELIHESIQRHRVSETIHFSKNYKVYKGVVGAGNEPIFIFTSGKRTIPLGDAEIYLKELKKSDKDGFYIEFLSDFNEEFKLLKEICKASGISLTYQVDDQCYNKSYDKLFNDLFTENASGPFLFKQGTGLPKSELIKISDIREVANYAISNGLDKDPLITLKFVGEIPEVNPNMIRPRTVMPYQSHSIVITNPKVSKSSNARSVGKCEERPTIAHLLGFATANKKVEGTLHLTTSPFALDEIQEEEGEDELWGKLHTHLEIGNMSIGRAMGVTCESYGSISFLGNPKLEKTNDGERNNLEYYQKIEMIYLFKNILKKISTNCKALGSRLGVIIFRYDLKEVRGTPLSEEERDLLDSFIHTIKEEGRDGFTSLFKNNPIWKWLNEEFDEVHKRNIDEISNKIPLLEIKEFLQGQKSSYRHLKGFCLKLAWLDYLAPYFKTGNINYEEILDSAKGYYPLIKNVNIQSYLTIADLTSGDLYYQYLESLIKNLDPLYTRLFLFHILEWNEQRNKDVTICVFDELAKYYPVLTDSFGKGAFQRYDGFLKIRKEVLKRVSQSSDILYQFGVTLSEFESDYAIIIRDAEHLNKVSEVYQRRIKTSTTPPTPTFEKDDKKESRKQGVNAAYLDKVSMSSVSPVPEEWVFDSSSQKDLLVYVNAHPKDNAVFVDENFDKELVSKLLNESIIFESPKGTYKVL